MNGKFGLKLLLPFVLVSLAIVLGFTTKARADLPVSEAGLNPSGLAFEINPDDVGKLWITDSQAHEVWEVDPSSGAYIVFPVNGSPTDARQAGGWLWWADYLTNTLGQVKTSDGTFSSWQVPGAVNFSGTNLDTQGRFYATDSTNPYLYRLDPNPPAQLCSFALPGVGNYIVRDGDYLWLTATNMIMRLQISNNSLTTWSLPLVSSPMGLAVDTLGNLWYADESMNVIAQLDPNTSQLTSYALPTGFRPEMIAIQSGYIWYTTQTSLPSIGRLDPLVANHNVTLLDVQSPIIINPVCNSISPSSTGTVTPTSGNLNWTDTSYSSILNTGGWKIYQMPGVSSPWGITVPTLGYVVDQGRQELIRFAPVLHLRKTVTNDNGRSALATDWTLSAAGPTPLSGATPVDSGATFSPGTYTLSESGGPAGYTASAWSCVKNAGTPVIGSSITMELGDEATCTINNDDIAPVLHLRKTVTNDNGGTALATDWTLSAAGPTPLSGTTPVDSGASFTTGTYTLSESGGPVGYTASGWSCVKNAGTPVIVSTITMGLGDEATCTIINDDHTPTLHLRKLVINNSGGTALAALWTLSAAGPTPLSGATPVDSSYSFTAGTYNLSESGGPAGYTASAWSCVKNGSAPVIGSSITLKLGDEATCTIINDDNAPILHLRKLVINNSGRTALATQWTLAAAGPTPLSGTTPVDSSASFTAGTYILSESGGPSGYTASAWSCVKNVGAPVIGSTITLGLGDEATCTITNDDIPPDIFLPIIYR